MATKLYITWSTNYNGVWVGPESIDDNDEYNVVEKANEDMGLAGMTYDMCSDLGPFDDPTLTAEQIDTLIDVVKSNAELKKLYGEFEVEFEYDTTST